MILRNRFFVKYMKNRTKILRCSGSKTKQRTINSLSPLSRSVCLSVCLSVSLSLSLFLSFSSLYFISNLTKFEAIVSRNSFIYLYLQPSSLSSTLKSAAIFNEMASKVKSMTLPAKPSNLVFQWNIIKRGAAAASWSKLSFFCKLN